MKSGKEHYWAIHSWLRKYPKKGYCSECDKKGKTDWANISGDYLRDIVDYLELCRSCHNVYDGRSKISANDVRKIRSDYANGIKSQYRLARDYKVSGMTIWNIIHRHKWEHIK